MLKFNIYELDISAHPDQSPCYLLPKCSAETSIKFQSLIKKLKIKTFLAFKLSDVEFIMLINVKMPRIVCISTFISMKRPCTFE